MRLILPKLNKYGWNHRVLTEEDFESFCEQDGVLYLEMKMKWDGIYLVRQLPVIGVNTGIKGINRTIVKWHEMAHHWLHVPDSRFFRYGNVDKSEYEAHVVAACALIPAPMLKNLWSLQEEYGYPKDLIHFRYSIHSCYGF